MARISASVVMYGGAQEVHACLESVAAHTTAEGFTLYLVDNNSPDNALQAVQQMGLPACVTVLPQKENRGYGAGHNTVLPLLNSQYHAVINPDVFLYDDALDKMANWMDAHSDVVITTPRLQFPDGREQHIAKRRPALLPLIARQISLPFLKKYEQHYLMLDEDLSEPTEVEFCSGSFFMIRTEVLQKIGGFDEDYFMYVEDADITAKARQCGRAVYLPQVTVAHAWHREAHKQVKQFFWQLKSMLRYFKKWGFRLT